jgi:hypothetical protein
MTPPHDSEWRTRKRLIDPKLKAAGWRVVELHDSGRKPLVATSSFGANALISNR